MPSATTLTIMILIMRSLQKDYDFECPEKSIYGVCLEIHTQSGQVNAKYRCSDNCSQCNLTSGDQNNKCSLNTFALCKQFWTIVLEDNIRRKNFEMNLKDNYGHVSKDEENASFEDLKALKEDNKANIEAFWSELNAIESESDLESKSITLSCWNWLKKEEEINDFFENMEFVTEELIEII